MKHHEYASLFPMMSDAEIQTLVADIKANGKRGFVVSHNLHRRHLTESQLSMIAARLAIMKAGAPEGNKNAAKSTPPIGEVVSFFHQTREEAAAALNVGPAPRLLQRGRR